LSVSAGQVDTGQPGLGFGGLMGMSHLPSQRQRFLVGGPCFLQLPEGPQAMAQSGQDIGLQIALPGLPGQGQCLLDVEQSLVAFAQGMGRAAHTDENARLKRASTDVTGLGHDRAVALPGRRILATGFQHIVEGMEHGSLVQAGAKLAAEPQPLFPMLPGLLVLEAHLGESREIVPDPHLVVLVPHLLEDGQRRLDTRRCLFVLALNGMPPTEVPQDLRLEPASLRSSGQGQALLEPEPGSLEILHRALGDPPQPVGFGFERGIPLGLQAIDRSSCGRDGRLGVAGIVRVFGPAHGNGGPLPGVGQGFCHILQGSQVSLLGLPVTLPVVDLLAGQQQRVALLVLGLRRQRQRPAQVAHRFLVGVLRRCSLPGQAGIMPLLLPVPGKVNRQPGGYVPYLVPVEAL
jgi:hypothetical protein